MTFVEACPARDGGLPHVWAGAVASGDGQNPCRYCGASGRAHFARATAAQAERFSRLEQPASVKAWGKAS